jgi:phosphatidate cytidylyltransferase
MAIKNSTLRAITGLFLGTGLWFLFFYCPPIIFSIVLVILMCGMLAELKNMVPSTIKFLFLAPLYPIIPCLILIYANQSPQYRYLLFYLCVIVFTFDTTCYLTGTACSKFWTTHKIIPSISPGKSWEGFCGGLITTTALLFFIARHHNSSSGLQIFMLSCAICTIAFAGDIFESYLKRSAGIKDSGTILPGHGGLLDRFDAILFVSYFFFIFKNYLVTIL